MLPEYKKILYATDLSSSARQALGHAAALAERFQAEVTVLHVLPDNLELLSEQAGMDLVQAFGQKAADWIGKGDRDKAVEAVHERLEALAAGEFHDADAARHFAQAGIKVVCGDAAERIAAESRLGYDLVVMGTHGHGGLFDVVLGSVARDTIRHSGVPVLVVPLPHDHPDRC